ncbi:biopolymer transporter Tol [Arsenicicoccus piscis]|uniref:Biopolymer transporter Tol n=1 Tax=Arsenicicoccus piscis TaxID=673954 RepID=A0ABQ6HTT7_9MICO|nr:biopolymer transporter Tol [Arsenicicoccus piscis]MCH8626369.1 biopolymer transporter Tol [Arsenicicoccus piscis]GMA20985.1 hypothetical protein GCM10025862_30060 [Arsenicicoccus piscis]
MAAFGRALIPGQTSVVYLHDIIDDDRITLWEDATQVVEAPNITSDGTWVVVNAQGRLHRLPLGAQVTHTGAPRTGGGLEEIDTGTVHNANNDHLVSPDGRFHYLTAGGELYRVPWEGGPATRVSPDTGGRAFRHYLHGISPEGDNLSFVGLEGRLGSTDVIRTNVFTLDLATGTITQLTDVDAPCDGSEWSPDGRTVYFNSELASTVPGHSQLFRVAGTGGEPEQLTFDERVNWFPHVSPDGHWLAYVSYEPGTTQHPPNVPAQIRLLDLTDPRVGTPELPVRVLADVFGGQGAMNVSSWHPDSRRLAYVDFPVA